MDIDKLILKFICKAKDRTDNILKNEVQGLALPNIKTV